MERVCAKAEGLDRGKKRNGGKCLDQLEVQASLLLQSWEKLRTVRYQVAIDMPGHHQGKIQVYLRVAPNLFVSLAQGSS